MKKKREEERGSLRCERFCRCARTLGLVSLVGFGWVCGHVMGTEGSISNLNLLFPHSLLLQDAHITESTR